MKVASVSDQFRTVNFVDEDCYQYESHKREEDRLRPLSLACEIDRPWNVNGRRTDERHNRNDDRDDSPKDGRRQSEQEEEQPHDDAVENRDENDAIECSMDGIIDRVENFL